MHRSIQGPTSRRRSPRHADRRVPIKCAPDFAPTDGSIRVLTHPDRRHSRVRGVGRFDSVASPATLAGSTTHFHVYYTNRLGKIGSEIALAALDKCERDYKILADFFEYQDSLMFNVIIAPLSPQIDGSGGAYHRSCLAKDLYCDAQTTPII